MNHSITLISFALLSSIALGDYQRASIPFDRSLDCTACIRGGWNYCNDTQTNEQGEVITS